MVLSVSAQHPAIGGYNVYFGSLHNHSDISDGSGTPEEAYTYARNTAHLDFFGLSDHSTSLTSAQWTEIRTQANAFNQDGVFTTFFGFEWSSFAGYGHVTVFNTVDYCPANPPTLSLPDLLIWLLARPAGLAYFNHPGEEETNGIEFDHFSIPPSDQVIGIELWNRDRGFSKFYYNDGYYSGDNNKSYIDEANNRGWRLGALGSDDNHTGTWGTDVPYRMAILSNNLTRSDLLSAIQARRFYATLDKNLSLSFKINGMEMGSTVAGGIDTLHIQAHDEDGEMFSEVVLFDKNHNTVNTWSLNNATVDLSLNLNTSEGEYYYVKIRQADGDEAISSPVWISSVTSNQDPFCSIFSPENNTILTAPANITINANAADQDGTISKVEFYQGAAKLGEDVSSPYTLTWNNVTPGSYTLTAIATDNSGGTTTSLPVAIKVGTRPVTISADVKAKQYGDPDPVLTYRITSGSLFGTDSFTGSLKRTSGENIGTYTISQGTLSLNSNYTITYIGANLTITPRPVIVAADARIKIYGDPDPALTWQITSGSLAGTDNFTGFLIRNAGENTGTYTITRGTLALGSNYNLTFTPANLTIKARPIAIAAENSTKMYGDADVLTYHIASGNLIGTDAFSGTLGRDPGENAGTYAIRQGTLTLNTNYNITFSGADLVITQRPVSVSADHISKIYGESDPRLTYRITSGRLINTDTFSGSLVRDAGEISGTYLIKQGNLALNSNYILSFTGADLEITLRPITIKADHLTKVYGENDPGLTYQITSGSIAGNGDAITGALVREAGEDAGVYAITQGSLVLNSNYAMIFLGSDLEITPRPITITANPRKKVLGEPDPELTYRITSGTLAGTDAFSGSLIREPGEEVGTYSISVGDLTPGNNYDLTFIGADFRITENFEMKIYPNPFKDNLTIEFELNQSSGIGITLYSLNGMKIATVFSGDLRAGPYRFDFAPVNARPGALVLQLMVDGQIILERMVIRE
jgi:hypothetical protein